MAITGTSEN